VLPRRAPTRAGRGRGRQRRLAPDARPRERDSGGLMPGWLHWLLDPTNLLGLLAFAGVAVLANAWDRWRSGDLGIALFRFAWRRRLRPDLFAWVARPRLGGPGWRILARFVRRRAPGAPLVSTGIAAPA